MIRGVIKLWSRRGVKEFPTFFCWDGCWDHFRFPVPKPNENNSYVNLMARFIGEIVTYYCLQGLSINQIELFIFAFCWDLLPVLPNASIQNCFREHTS